MTSTKLFISVQVTRKGKTLSNVILHSQNKNFPEYNLGTITLNKDKP